MSNKESMETNVTKSKDETNETKPKEKSKPRCYCCRKKLKMTELNFLCKCGHLFCQSHLNPHSHNCSFNYLKERQDLIKQKNPKMCVQCIEVK
jgi:hypothetical protein